MAVSSTARKTPQPKPRRAKAGELATAKSETAKALESLTAAKHEWRKSGGETHGFVNTLATLLSMRRSAKGRSHYATFLALNGRKFTLRISDHNANVRNLERHGQRETISIVFSRNRNRGLVQKAGNAHVSEFFYPLHDIEESEGKPLAIILGSLTNTLRQGVYNDQTGLAATEIRERPAHKGKK